MITVPGLTYPHPEHGNQPVEILESMLPNVGRMYVHHQSIVLALRRHGTEAAPWRTFAHMVDSQFNTKSSFFLGFSGYTDPRFDYSAERKAIRDIYRYLAVHGRFPTHSIDGGGPHGVLGAAGSAARRFEVESTAITPLAGLKFLNPRDHILVWGDTFQQRQVIVGLLPDMLIVLGGQEAALDECLTAIGYGTPVVLIAAKEYNDPRGLTNIWHTVPKLAEAYAKQQLFVCPPDGDMYGAIANALARLDRNNATTGLRARRLHNLRSLLGIHT